MVTLFFCAIGFSFVVFAVAEAASGAKDPLWRVFSSMLAGAAALIVLHIAQPLTGVEMPITLLTLAVGIIGGVPGAAVLALLSFLFL